MSLMTSVVSEDSGEIRGVQVRWVSVAVAGHTVEQLLIYDVADAERVYGRPIDEEMDRHIQTGMYATDRIATDGTMHKVASATSYVLDGKCIRTAKIEYCSDIEPGGASSTKTGAEVTAVECKSWSCAQGTPKISHGELSRTRRRRREGRQN